MSDPGAQERARLIFRSFQPASPDLELHVDANTVLVYKYYNTIYMSISFNMCVK